uniref:Speckle-type POZ protein n=1 Tax=Panagrolaimus sp. PS1159 TaxID=55785 RepID=A0AC35EXK5_9BILA
MPEYPFAIEFTVSKDRLNTLKNSTNNEFLESNKFAAFTDSGTKYFLKIYPNGDGDERRGKTMVFLNLELGNKKKVQAEFKVSIKSANLSSKFDAAFEKSTSWGALCCTTDELFDSSKNFIADGKLIVKIEGIFQTESVGSKLARKLLEPKSTTTNSPGVLWNSGFEDFSVVSDGKEIKVHKCVLASQSPVFAAMLKPHTKEAIEGKVEIIDFSYDIVEQALKLCYNYNLISEISVDESLLLLKFADKYDTVVLKNDLEEYLADKISVSSICEIAKYAISENVLKLQSKCMDSLALFLSKNKFVPNMKLLDKDFLISAIAASSCHTSEIL